jgi:hypothetical protein
MPLLAWDILGRLHTVEMAGLLNEAEVMHATDMPLNGHGLEATFQIDSFVDVFCLNAISRSSNG